VVALAEPSPQRKSRKAIEVQRHEKEEEKKPKDVYAEEENDEEDERNKEMEEEEEEEEEKETELKKHRWFSRSNEEQPNISTCDDAEKGPKLRKTKPLIRDEEDEEDDLGTSPSHKKDPLLSFLDEKEKGDREEDKDDDYEPPTTSVGKKVHPLSCWPKSCVYSALPYSAVVQLAA